MAGSSRAGMIVTELSGYRRQGSPDSKADRPVSQITGNHVPSVRTDMQGNGLRQCGGASVLWFWLSC